MWYLGVSEHGGLFSANVFLRLFYREKYISDVLTRNMWKSHFHIAFFIGKMMSRAPFSPVDRVPHSWTHTHTHQVSLLNLGRSESETQIFEC